MRGLVISLGLLKSMNPEDKRWLLKARQSLPLNIKVRMTQQRIEQWYTYWGGDIYVAFSGGKDSTVLAHIARSLYPNIPLVFNDTGLEYPEIRNFVKTWSNVTWLKPKMSFREVLTKYGYPVVSKEVSQKIYQVRTTKSEKLRHKRLHGDNNKYRSGKIPEKWKFLIDAPFQISHKCCDALKKRPAAKYTKETDRQPLLGTMTIDSHFRRQTYLRYGCNAYNLTRPRSMPMAFWTTDDVWEYIKTYNVSYCSVYDTEGIIGTGCVFCAFGAHRANPNKFQLLAQTHPKLHAYCMDNLGMREVLEYMNINFT